NSLVQNDRTIGSRTCFRTQERYRSSTSIRGTPRSETFSHSMRAATEAYRMYSNRGPHESRQRCLNAETTLDDSRYVRAAMDEPTRLKPIGKSESAGLK